MVLKGPSSLSIWRLFFFSALFLGQKGPTQLLFIQWDCGSGFIFWKGTLLLLSLVENNAVTTIGYYSSVLFYRRLIYLRFPHFVSRNAIQESSFQWTQEDLLCSTPVLDIFSFRLFHYNLNFLWRLFFGLLSGSNRRSRNN